MAENPREMMDEDMHRAIVEVNKMKSDVRRDKSLDDGTKNVLFDLAELSGVSHCKSLSVRRDLENNLSGLIKNVGGYIAGEELQPLPGLPSEAGKKFMSDCVGMVRKTSR